MPVNYFIRVFASFIMVWVSASCTASDEVLVEDSELVATSCALPATSRQLTKELVDGYISYSSSMLLGSNVTNGRVNVPYGGFMVGAPSWGLVESKSFLSTSPCTGGTTSRICRTLDKVGTFVSHEYCYRLTCSGTASMAVFDVVTYYRDTCQGVQALYYNSQTIPGKIQRTPNPPNMTWRITYRPTLVTATGQTMYVMTLTTSDNTIIDLSHTYQVSSSYEVSCNEYRLSGRIWLPLVGKDKMTDVTFTIRRLANTYDIQGRISQGASILGTIDNSGVRWTDGCQ